MGVCNYSLHYAVHCPFRCCRACRHRRGGGGRMMLPSPNNAACRSSGLPTSRRGFGSCRLSSHQLSLCQSVVPGAPRRPRQAHPVGLAQQPASSVAMSPPSAPPAPPSTSSSLLFDEVPGKPGRHLREHFMPVFRPDGYVLARPAEGRGLAGVTLPAAFRELGPAVRSLAVREDDVWVVSFPKTGTTWTQEMVWLIGHDLDYAGAKVNLPERFPMLDHTVLFDYRKMDIPMPDLPEFVTDSLGYIDRLPGPRFIKTHLPYQLLPTQLQDPKCKAKMVYVCRNPKDTCVSYFHHCRLIEGYTGDFHDFCDLFLDGLISFGPFWPHVLDFWERRDQPNVLFITYEQLKQDLAGMIRRTADFLGKKLSDDEVDKLKHHLSFESMKNNPAVNYEEVININRKYNLAAGEGCFMRSGSVGNWKCQMTPEQSQRFDEWSQRHLKGTGLQL